MRGMTVILSLAAFLIASADVAAQPPDAMPDPSAPAPKGGSIHDLGNAFGKIFHGSGGGNEPPSEKSTTNSGGGMLENLGNSLEKVFSNFGAGSNSGSGPTAGRPLDTSKAHGIHDLFCDQGIVDPFEISDNVGAALASGVEAGLGALLRLALGAGTDSTGRPASVRDEAIKAAKRAARNMNWLPMALEREIGEQLHAEEVNLIPRGSKSKADQRAYAAADALLETLLPLIPAAHPYEFKLFVVRDPSFNAKAIPGGHLYVNLGALAYRGEKGKARQDKLDRGLFALSHELSHVLKRHQTREVQTRIIDTVDTADKLKDLMKSGKSNLELVLGAVAYMKKLHESYSPDQERQADACALRLMTPFGAPMAARAFEAFAADLPEVVNVEGSLHPVKADRLGHGRQALVYIQANATPGQGWQIAPAAGKP